MTLAPSDTRPTVRGRPLRDPAVWLRVALAVVGLGLVGAVLALGSRQASYADLERAIDRGDVGSVSVTDGLPARATGYGVQEVRWRDGLIGHHAQVLQVSPGTPVPATVRAPP